MPGRQLRFTQRGEYLLDFPPECPVRLIWYEFSGEHRVTPNSHNFPEVMQIIEGQGRFIIENCSYRIAPGDVLLVGPGEFHRIEAPAGRRLRLAALHFQSDLIHRPGGSPLDLEYLRPFLFRGPDFSHHLARSEVPAALITDRLARIEQAIRASRHHQSLMVRTYLADILLEITRARTWTGGADTPLGRRARDLARLRPVFAVVRERFAERLSLHELAASVHLSPHHFCRVFRAVVGSSFTEYQLRLRVDAAAEQLTGSDRSVAEIAQATGFASQSHFNRAFKRLQNTTPLAYARRHR